MCSGTGGLALDLRATAMKSPRVVACGWWPLLPGPMLVAQGLELRFDLAMIIHILRDIHVPGGSFPPGPGVGVLPVPLQPSHEATDNGQAGLPGLMPWAGHGASLWLWVWLLMRNLQGLVDVGVFLLVMRKLPGIVDVRVLLCDGLEVLSGSLGLGT